MSLRLFIHRSPARFERIRSYSNRLLAFLFFLALISLTAEHGFHIGDGLRSALHVVEAFILGSFILLQIVKLYLAPNRGAWLHERRIEYGLTGLLLLAFALLPLLLQSFDPALHRTARSQITALYIVFVQVVIVTDILFSTVRIGRGISSLQIRPARIFIASFVLAITLGTLGLLLPRATSHGISVIDALFTSTSAVCVTGLAVVDTATHFTFLGKMIILVLIQIGGLGLMTFTTFFTLFSGRLSIRERVMMQDMLSRENLGEVRKTLMHIVGVTFAIEAIGAVFLFISWPGDAFSSLQEKIFSSVFHSISAFCNAGFSLFSANLMHPGVAMNPVLNITIASLIVLGGLGFLTIVNIAKVRPWARNESRLRNRLTTHSRVVLISTAILIIGGSVLIFLWEFSTSLTGLTWSEKILASVFQSITTRTAGFNTIDVGAMALPTTLVVILLMFIGASPASTGGGIKTTTASVVLLNALNHIRGKKAIEIGARTIPPSIVERAQTAFLFGLMHVFLAVLLVSWLEPFSLTDVLFECVSAMGTVGLSRGITSSLSEGSKIVLIFTMLIGRVGALTFMQSLTKPVPSNRYDYPTESVIVT